MDNPRDEKGPEERELQASLSSYRIRMHWLEEQWRRAREAAGESPEEGNPFPAQLEAPWRLMPWTAPEKPPETPFDGPRIRCLMVEPGKEAATVRLLKVLNLGKGLYPQRVRIRKIRGKWMEDTIRLLPGYVFVYTDDEIPVWRYQFMDHVLKVLRYDREPDGYLRGVDLEFSETVGELDGKIDLMEAVSEGDFIHITDTLLKKINGRVVRVNRQKRLAEIEADLLGQKRTLMMNYKLIGDEEEKTEPETPGELEDPLGDPDPTAEAAIREVMTEEEDDLDVKLPEGLDVLDMEE